MFHGKNNNQNIFKKKMLMTKSKPSCPWWL